MPLLPHETTDIDYLKEVVAQTLEQRESVFASVWLQLLSKLYLHQCTISSRKSFGSIDELIMDGVDHETIWEQLQVQYSHSNSQFTIKVDPTYLIYRAEISL